MSDILMDGFKPQDKDSKSFKVIVLKYLRYWYWYLLGVILSFSLAYAYVQYATPEYPIASTILINASSKGSDFTQNAVYSDLENYQSIKLVENETEVLKSVSLMKLALEELDFNVSYFGKDNFLRDKESFGAQVPIKVVLHEYDSMAFFDKEMNTTFRIHIINEKGFELEDEAENREYHEFGDEIADQFGNFSIQASKSLTFPTTIIIKFNNPYALAGRYSSKLDVFLVNKLASVVRISLTDPVPQKGMLVLSKLIEIYNKEAVRNKNQTAMNTISFIDEQLTELTLELRNIEQKVGAFKRENKITQLSSDAQQYSYNSNLSKNQLSEYTIQLDILKSIEKYLMDQEVDYQAVPSSLTIQDQTLQNLISKFNELHMDRERMLRTTQPSNPLILNLDQQLTSFKRNILENIKNIQSGLEISRNNLLDRSNQLDIQSQKVPEIERRLLEISRQQEIKQEHYTYLIEKKEEAALSLAATTVSNSRIIDPAMAGNKPVKPNKMLILGFAFIMGLGVPVGFVFAKHQLSDKILLKEDVVSRTNITFLGEISRNPGKKPIAISENLRSPVAEQFRLVRTNLQFALPSHDNKIILVTSSLSGEGKTFFSLNLGISLSMVGKKVAVCEFDLRKPALMDYLDIEYELGISDYLQSDDVTISDLINRHKGHYGKMDLFGCGNIPENPSELMLIPKVGYFIEQLKAHYDVIIIDSAPVGQVADAFSLSKFVDITVYLMRYNYTSISMIDFLNENFQDKKLRNPAIVLNDGKPQLGYGYGYYQDGKEEKRTKNRRINQKPRKHVSI
ncbi:MAG: GNVR domain-containing protein [Anditalea sp.]